MQEMGQRKCTSGTSQCAQYMTKTHALTKSSGVVMELLAGVMMRRSSSECGAHTWKHEKHYASSLKIMGLSTLRLSLLYVNGFEPCFLSF